MELMKDISGEQLPQPSSSRRSSRESSVDLSGQEFKQKLSNLSEAELTEKVETILLEKVKNGDNVALFQLGQLYFEQEDYEKSRQFFDRASAKGDLQATFQLGVLLYDGLGGSASQKQGFECMMQVATSTSRKARHLTRAAQYNIGRAYLQGYGVRHSDAEAERHFLLAADDGNPKASIKAQSTLGLFYSQGDFKNLKKAFFWHSEACGNGSLESQGALGVMYLSGLGCRKDADGAFVCLREAAERGNVYAMGNLVTYYYRRKLYSKTVELAARVAQFSNVEQISEEIDCLPGYVAKGVALACFYYGRCLHLGLGIQQDKDEAQKYYSRCYQFDPDTCASLQTITQHGTI